MRLISLLTAFLAAFLSVSCVQTLSYLPTVIAAVQDGVMVLDTISRFWAYWQASHPKQTTIDPAKVDLAIDRARSSLNVALRTAQGVEKLDQAQVDAAFVDFKASYTELIALVSKIGVKSGDKLSATPWGLTVPEPLALKLKVK